MVVTYIHADLVKASSSTGATMYSVLQLETWFLPMPRSCYRSAHKFCPLVRVQPSLFVLQDWLYLFWQPLHPFVNAALVFILIFWSISTKTSGDVVVGNAFKWCQNSTVSLDMVSRKVCKDARRGTGNFLVNCRHWRFTQRIVNNLGELCLRCSLYLRMYRSTSILKP